MSVERCPYCGGIEVQPLVNTESYHCFECDEVFNEDEVPLEEHFCTTCREFTVFNMDDLMCLNCGETMW